MTTRQQRHRAALLYAGALLHQDDGVLATLFSGELQNIADSLLRRARFDQSECRWPTVEEIQAVLQEVPRAPKS